MSLQILLAEESKGERDRRMSLGKYTLTQKKFKVFLGKTSYFPKLSLDFIIYYQRHLAFGKDVRSQFFF